MQNRQLSGKTALVTGSTSGIGLGIAHALAAQGANIMFNGFGEASLIDQLQKQTASDHGVKTAYNGADMSKPAEIETLMQEAAAHFGGVDILVNNAGISLICPAEDTSLDQWHRVMAINLAGPFLLSRALGAGMLARGRGSIVNVASVAGLGGVIHRAAYNASKHGLIGLTRTLAAEWGGRGVRVNAVCPGWIKTEMDIADQGSGAYGDDDIINRVPMARFATPEDVARAIAFLAEGDGFLNGVSLPVDGGWTADNSWDALRLKTR